MMTWQYLAGFVDGEGTIGFCRGIRWDGKGYLYRPTLSVTNNHKGVLLMAKALAGRGQVYLQRHANAKHATSYHWRYAGQAIAPALVAMRPHLSIKKRQADLMLEFLARRAQQRTRPLDEQDYDCISAMTALNRRGPKRISS